MTRTTFYLAAAVGSLGLAIGQTQAGNIVWDGDTTTAWSLGDNWVNGVAPASDTTTDTAVFSGAPTANQPHIGTGRTVAAVNFQSAGWSIGSNGGAELILGATSGLDSSGAGTNTINTGKLRAQGGTWNIAGGNTLEINAAVTWQSGTTQFSGNGTNAGTVIFNATAANNSGTVRFSSSGGVPAIHLGANDALGTGTMTVTNSTSFTALNAPRSLNNAITHEVTGGTITFTGDNFTLKKKITIGGGGNSNDPRSISVGSNTTTTANAGIDAKGRLVAKTGSGTLILNGTTTLNNDGTTNTPRISVTGGTLLINGTVSATSGEGGLITANAGTTLGGIGSVAMLAGRTVTANGTLAPGTPATNSGVGALTIGTLGASNHLTLGNGSIFAVQLNGATVATEYDQVVLAGNLTLSAGVDGADLAINLGYTPLLGQQFVLINKIDVGAISGVFKKLNGVSTDLSEGSSFTVASTGFQISYLGPDGSTGNDVVLTVIPEPASLALLAAGGLLMLGRGNFRGRREQA